MLRPEDFKDYPGQRDHRGRGTIAFAMLSLIAGSTFAFGVAHASASGATVWVQTLDSCREAVSGATYQITDSRGFSQRSAAPQSAAARSGGGRDAGVRSVNSSGGCPLDRGDCSSATTGCAVFSGLPASDTFRISEVGTPPSNPSNPDGYAPCEGGSACQWQLASLSTDAAGNASAVTTNVEPNGTEQRFPSNGGASGAQNDPVIFHDFGLGSGSCDGDHDADDHLTGSGPSASCQYPENQEASACQPYPWSCSSSWGSSPRTASGGSSAKPAQQGSSSSRKGKRGTRGTPGTRGTKGEKGTAT